jgi:hypothetical protein
MFWEYRVYSCAGKEKLHGGGIFDTLGAMKKYYYIYGAIWALLLLALMLGIGHATIGGLIFGMLLFHVQLVHVVMLVLLVVNHRKEKGFLKVLSLIILTAGAPWLMMGIF